MRSLKLATVLALLSGIFPASAISTSNTAKLDLATACPALPDKAAGELFEFKLHHLQKPLLANRSANIWYNPGRKTAETNTVIFYWHGTDGTTEEIDQAFGKNGVQELLSRGYVVVAPDHIRDGNGAGVLKYSWYIANGSRLNYDIVLGDLIAQCLNAKFRQSFQIITSGCSAGAMQSALWSFQNRDIVGIILYSGGIFRLPEFVARKKFWSVITHGGVKDKRGDFNFMNTAIHIHNRVLKLGHESALCDFTPQGHDIHPEIAGILTNIVFDPEHVVLPGQCSKKKH